MLLLKLIKPENSDKETIIEPNYQILERFTYNV
jgi:hypothetical protein